MQGLEGTLSIVEGVGRPIVLLTKKRHPLAPNIPTINEVLEKIKPGVKIPDINSLFFTAVHREVKEKYPERYDLLVKMYESTMENPEYKKIAEKGKWRPIWFKAKVGEKMLRERSDVADTYKDLLLGR